MSADDVPDRLIDRLRSNLRAAGIPARDADIQGIIEKGFLSRQQAFDDLLARIPSQTLPDYLDDWGARSGAAPMSPVPPQTSAADAVASRPATIGDMARRIRAGDVTPAELTEQALAHLDERDRNLNAFQLVLAERARAAARQAERELAAGTDRGPLHGVPVAVKDLLLLDGTPTTAGSKILSDWRPAGDATAVERLHAAGAVIVGKTRLSEFAYSPGSNNAHYGPTANPWDRTRDTGGSSSGSAAAVAAGIVPAAIGSDTGGSIRIPASLCGIVGLKPTFGRISLHGAVPLAWSLDHLGPLTRSVGDAALMLEALGGPDERDPRARHAAPAVLATLAAGVAGVRIGVLGDDGSGRPLGADEALDGWRAGLTALQQAGAELVPVDVPELEDLRLLNGAILALEAAAYHLPMLRARLDDFGEFMRHRILGSFAYGPAALVSAQQARATLRRKLAPLFERIDLLCTPSQPDGAPPIGTIGATVFTAPFNVLGWPAISVPIGLNRAGLPLGLQLVGNAWDEATVLRAALVVEQALPMPAVL